ncbi:MAG: TonB family protein [Bacteroidales bacterium]|nr:TonB family protein [Bacteroidales bacterium]
MKRSVFVTLFFIAFSFVAGAQYVGSQMSYETLDDTELVASMRSHINYLCSPVHKGRKAGSDGERATAEYIYDTLKGYGVDMISPFGGDAFGMKTSSGDTLVSHNVVGFIEGYDSKLKNHYIVVGARMDNLGQNSIMVNGEKKVQTYWGANGNASGISMLLELARKAQQNHILFARSVIFVAFGAGMDGMAGAYYFLNRQFSREQKNIDLMIDLEALGTDENAFYAYTSANDDVNHIVNTLNNEVFPMRPEISYHEIYPADYRVFYAAGIPSVHFTSGRYQQHNTPKDTPDIINYDKMEQESEYIYCFLVHVAGHIDAPSFEKAAVIEKPDYSKKSDVVSYFDTSIRPLFGNSPDPEKFLREWVYYYLKYPREAVDQGIQGKVTVGFIIEKDGKVSNVHIVKGVDPLLDAEALRLVESSPAWKAGRLNGEKVRTAMSIVVEFRLESNKKSARFGINGKIIGKKR